MPAAVVAIWARSFDDAGADVYACLGVGCGEWKKFGNLAFGDAEFLAESFDLIGCFMAVVRRPHCIADAFSGVGGIASARVVCSEFVNKVDRMTSWHTENYI